jgi:hypothetical protein
VALSIEPMNKEAILKSIYFIPGMAILGLFIVYGVQDYWVIGVIKDPAIIEQYHFGSEAMIGNGGDKYRSAEAYALSSLVVGLVAIAALATSLYFLFKAQSFPLVKSYIAVIVSVVLIFVIGRTW